jgi:hypothetical protein
MIELKHIIQDCMQPIFIHYCLLGTYYALQKMDSIYLVFYFCVTLVLCLCLPLLFFIWRYSSQSSMF